MERDWANLEALPLGLILDNLEEKIDHLWFSVVCKNWQLIAKLNHQNHQFKMNTIPMVMVPPNDSLTNKNGLFGIPNKRLYPFQFQLGLIKPNLHLCGSSHGWLALVDDSRSIITLMNPFQNIPYITLPPLNRVYKVTLSADPIKNPNDYVVAAIHGNSCDLAFIKSGQKNWTYMEILEPFFIDVIFYKGLLFAITIHRKIISINICGSNNLLPNVILEEKVEEGIFQDKFLVKSLNEELWMVKRCALRRNVYHVYKLKLDAKGEKLEEMCKLKSLGDDILFLGQGDSISVSASYFSKSLQRDSIYFADFLKIYNMKNGKSRCHGPYGKYTFWILPHFQWD
ncbi:unnamed protein product [Lathyrus sativus]|nr:unnamed protein product [Lathyrus sativus]